MDSWLMAIKPFVRLRERPCTPRGYRWDTTFVENTRPEKNDSQVSKWKILEDLGRSWKILDPWSVKPNHKTIFNITILMGIWWYHPQSASVMVGRFMAPRPAAHVQRAGCRWPKHPLNLRGR